MLELVKFLQHTLSPSEVDQKAAVNFLTDAALRNFPQFVTKLSDVLMSTDGEPFVRQQSGLQLKSLFFTKDAEQNRNRWISLPSDVREHVKQNIIRSLGTENARPSAAAQCVSAIASIELPFNQDDNVINVLVTNIINDHCIIHLKEASLQALGYICQDVDENALEKNSNEILNSIYLGMKHNDATVRLSATEAMLNALELTKFQGIRHCLILAQECQKNEFCDTRIRVAALQCLVRVVSLYYNQMQIYMKEALEITVHAMKSTDYDVSLQGIEFWSNICEFESLLIRRGQAVVNMVVENQCQYYSKEALQHILPSLLNILAIQEEDDDDDEWSPAKSAGVCITLFAQCTKDLIIPCTLSFIHQHLESTNWRFREAAITAFGSILDGPSQEYINQLVEGEIMSLINTLDDPHVKVRSTSVWAIGRVCDFCKYIVTRNEYYPKLISAFFKALGQEPAVAFNASWALSSLVKAAYETVKDQGNDMPETCVLSPVFEEIMEHLLIATDRTDSGEHNLQSAGYEALMEAITYSPKDCYLHIKQTATYIHDKLLCVVGNGDGVISSNDCYQHTSLLCATLQSILLKINTEDALKSSDSIMSVLLQVMQSCPSQTESAMEEALLAVSVLINKIGEKCDKYMEKFTPILFRALQLHDDYQICQAAIGVVSDLCNVFEERVAPIMETTTSQLFQILENSSVDRTVIPYVFCCFGDIVNAINPSYNWVNDNLAKHLANAVNNVKINNPNDFEESEYVESLINGCLLVFTCILQTRKNSEDDLKQESNIVSLMIKLIAKVAEGGNLFSENLQNTACTLINDLKQVFGKHIFLVLDTPDINELLQRCSRSHLSKALSLIPKN